MKHAEVREMLALHALGALRGRDARDVEAHLDVCGSCSAELIDLGDAVVELARAAPPRTPSRDVTRRILDGPSQPVVRWHPRRAWPLRTLTGVAVAAVLAILVVSQVSLRRRLDRATAMLAQGRQLLDFMSSPDVVTVALAPTDSAPEARALVAYDRRSRRVMVVSLDLPPPPVGQVYQLWLIADDVRLGGILSTERRGGSVMPASASFASRDVPLFAITLEPTPGVPDPTGDIVLLGGPSRPLPAR
jgi:anti-sigma-K factor RskA